MKKGEIKIPTRDLLEDLVRVADMLGRGFMTRAEYIKHGKHSSCTVYMRFGSWNKALEECGLKINRNISHYPKRGDNVKKATYARNVPLRLRYLVLERDGFRCQRCGRNSKEDGVKLEIDHIVPVFLYGKTTYDNLQTLCRDCNRGKSFYADAATLCAVN